MTRWCLKSPSGTHHPLGSLAARHPLRPLRPAGPQGLSGGSGPQGPVGGVVPWCTLASHPWHPRCHGCSPRVPQGTTPPTYPAPVHRMYGQEPSYAPLKGAYEERDPSGSLTYHSNRHGAHSAPHIAQARCAAPAHFRSSTSLGRRPKMAIVTHLSHLEQARGGHLCSSSARRCLLEASASG